MDRLEVARLDPRNGVPLDTNTKLRAIPSRTAFLDEGTGELVPRRDPTVKWQLQAVARGLLAAGHRLRICHRHRRPEWNEVQVRDGARAPYYAGLMACGLLWVCPVCAAKVQTVRAGELREAIEHWRIGDGGIEFATLTVPHGRRDDLEELVRELLRGYAAMIRSRAYGTWAKAAGLIGTVRGLEVTWSPAHGWHPHLHVLQFREEAGPVDPDRSRRLFELWQHSIRTRTSLGTPGVAAFRLQDGSHAARYVNKLGEEYTWGAEDELARSHTKSGRGSSRSPFDLLRASAEGLEGPWGQLWRHYEVAFKGRTQLKWSRGLRRLLLGSEGLSDQAVADSIGQNDAILATINADDWRLIRSRNLQGTVLQVVAEHGADGLRHLLTGLRPLIPVASV